MDYVHHYASPLGGITIAGTENAVTGLWFDGQKYFGSTLSPSCEEKSLPVFEQADLWLDIYFGGKAPDFTPTIFFKATDFRKSVWEVLLKIPYGETMTYKEIASEIARQKGVPKMSAQAVGNAVGHNPISLIIPCHRVVGADGSLTGYAGGIDKKAKLLELEKAEIYR
ncbi:MAG: methylated-DNA--[protein]-cysteine S-methyltransferase [Oscillospiraceae bacterium]|nr:methylated-DNA--[protein]-cysteine S-methyltransferase [Oscillospiraceae bacterium]